MAKLGKAPSELLISQLKGKVDIYYRNGQWIAAGWPDQPEQRSPSAEEMAARVRFSVAAKLPGLIDGDLRQAWIRFAAPGTGVTWVDAFRAAVMRHSWLRSNGE